MQTSREMGILCWWGCFLSRESSYHTEWYIAVLWQSCGCVCVWLRVCLSGMIIPAFDNRLCAHTHAPTCAHVHTQLKRYPGNVSTVTHNWSEREVSQAKNHVKAPKNPKPSWPRYLCVKYHLMQLYLPPGVWQFRGLAAHMHQPEASTLGLCLHFVIPSNGRAYCVTVQW